MEANAEIRGLRWSPERVELCQALLSASRQMTDPKKTSDNPFFKSKYADLSAVQEAVMPALEAHGIIVMQGPHANEDASVVHVDTELVHAASGQWVRCTASAATTKHDAQGAGSVITYLRRYALQSMTNCAAVDDDGNAGSTKPPGAARAPAAAKAPAAKPDPAPERAIDHITLARLRGLEAKVLEITGKPHAETVALIVKKAQELAGHLQTGKLDDLHEGAEVLYVERVMNKAIEEKARA